MISDGCIIYPGAKVIRSVLAPGVQVHSGSEVRESIILSSAVISANSTIERAIIDKRVEIGEGARIGGMEPVDSLSITMIGKNSRMNPGITVEAGAVIGTDVIPGDYSGNIIRGDDYVQTKRLPFEI
jgi:glucose-1-phosphate adenylyltransferase